MRFKVKVQSGYIVTEQTVSLDELPNFVTLAQLHNFENEHFARAHVLETDGRRHGGADAKTKTSGAQGQLDRPGGLARGGGRIQQLQVIIEQERRAARAPA